ncbi:MAG: hypothetical protein DCC55_13765 [Chloroflexi bacterium]|nr:MAG: hypothetical protein DCC55_13765 [Chloroflexota bacterium]
MIGLPAKVVALHPYDPAWPRLFQEEAARLQAAIGRYVLDIQHVGSTSIPGLAAKPIIDLAVAVANFEEAAVCIEPMERLGYEYRGENGLPRRHLFVKGTPRTHHVHINEIHSADWQQQIAFRDYLRARPDLTGEYARIKQQLARQFPTDRRAYTEQKSGFIFNVLRKAIPGLVPQPGDPLRVRMFRSNAECYRWWETTVEAVDDDSLVTFSPPGNLIHETQGEWRTQGAIRAHYWFARPYVLLEIYGPDGALGGLYVHVSSPALVKNAELYVTDHELDVVKQPGGPAQIVDEVEFIAAAATYGYSAEFQAFCRQIARDALTLVDHWQPSGWRQL